MTLAKHYMSNEVGRSIIGEIILDIRLDNIEKVFHLSQTDEYEEITNESADYRYKENPQAAKDIV